MSLQPGIATFGNVGSASLPRMLDPSQESDELEPLKAIGTVSRFGRNETIFSEGDAARYAYKIISGAVRLCKVLSDGRRQIADFRLAGDFFGLECSDDYALTAETLSETVLVRYVRSRLDRLEREQSGVQHCLLLVLKRDLAAAQNHLIMLGRQTARERVASFICHLVQRCGTGDCGTIEMPMGRQDVADYLGLTIETVCRAISELKRSRVVSVPDRHHIVLRNVHALEAIAEGEA